MPHRPAREPRRQQIASRPILFDGGINLLDPAQVRANQHVAGRNWFRGEDMVIRPRPGNLPYDPATVAPPSPPQNPPVFSVKGVLSFKLDFSRVPKWTEDSGATWAEVVGLPAADWIDLWWQGATTVWATHGAGRKVHKSTDSGKNFAVVGGAVHAVRSAGGGTITGSGITVIRPTGRIVVALTSAAAPNDTLAIAYSDDQAASWTTVIVDAEVLIGSRNHTLWWVSSNIVMLAARWGDGADRQQLFRSTDGGVTWARVGPVFTFGSSGRVDFLWVDPKTNYVFVGRVGPGEILRSTDLGATFQTVATGVGGGDGNFPSRSFIARNGLDEVIFMPFTGTGEGRKSTDDGATWVPYTTGPVPVILGGLYRMKDALINSKSDNSADNGYRSPDHGLTWPTMAGMPGQYVGFASPITGGA